MDERIQGSGREATPTEPTEQQLAEFEAFITELQRCFNRYVAKPKISIDLMSLKKS